ncbi:MAG TPA: hypothetical protein H9825_04210 [Candidatus Sphingobacterium stercorigallinarum]|nr:hypothetical protein [Candidatus Sphingobacterium stercorigallinarum]
MKSIYFVIPIFAAVLLACQQSTEEQQAAESPDKDFSSELTPPADDQVLVENDSIIELQLDRSGQTLKTSFEKEYQRIEVVVPNVKTDSLVGRLHLPGENRNIYISTISMPDNQTDGPFGNEIRYATEQSGTYIVTIAPNTRASGTILGPVEVTIDLK